MPRYTISKHTQKHGVHYDLMFERDDNLKAWKTESIDFSAPLSAEQNFDHRLIYLTHEGPIGGGRGDVRIWDTGEYDTVEWGERTIVFNCRGRRLRQALRLTLLDDKPGTGARWVIAAAE